MIALKIVESSYYPEKNLIVTQISGDIEKKDVEQWERSLMEALGQIKDGSTFKIFINLYDFKAVNLDVHKRFRNVIPLTLARFGWKVGYVNLFEEEAKTLTITQWRGIRCIAAAHCHHDETKIGLYETRYSSDNERYFTDPVEAESWIEGV